MARLKKSRAAEFNDLVDRGQKDFDPEDEPSEFSDEDVDSDSADSEAAVNANAGRAHYADVEKSALRKPEVAPLGPRYVGARVARDALAEDDEDDGGHDPFGEEGSEDASGSGSEDGLEDGEDLEMAEDGEESVDDELLDGEDTGDDEDLDAEDTVDTSMSDDEDLDDSEDAADEMADPHPEKQLDRLKLRKLMTEERGNVAATIAQANQADADKGRAVKRQRKTFDALLNSRIRLQQGLIAVNSMAVDVTAASSEVSTKTGVDADAIAAAEKAATNLWNTLESLRSSITSARTGSKRPHSALNITTTSPTPKIWSAMQTSNSAALPHHNLILQKWSSKTASASAQPSRGKLSTSRPSTIVDVLSEQLANPARLIKRTRTPRSCAPLQANAGVAESEAIYDDADFYGVLLKELLEQRSIDAGAAVDVSSSTAGTGIVPVDGTARAHWQAARDAKTKKAVDTKASKGRKLRYTVHEQLQNYMAPEERGSWGERQRDELFGGLLGRRMGGLAEEGGERGENGGDGDGDEVLGEEEALMLFRS